MNSYNSHRIDDKAKIISTITKDEAKAVAEAFISKINPEEFKSTKLLENNQPKTIGNQGFNFSYARLDGDIPVYGDYISVMVDGFTGKVTSYSIQWTDKLKTDKLNLPSKDNIIDKQKGTDLVSENTKYKYWF